MRRDGLWRVNGEVPFVFELVLVCRINEPPEFTPPRYRFESAARCGVLQGIVLSFAQVWVARNYCRCGWTDKSHFDVP